MLVPDADGRLHGHGPLALPFSTPRLQGRFGPGWTVEDLAVWGAGSVGSIRLQPAARISRSAALPNRLELTGAGSSFTAEALPNASCVVVDVQHPAPVLQLSLRSAAGGRRRPEGESLLLQLPRAVLIAWARGAVASDRRLVIPGRSRLILALGATEAEARRALTAVRQDPHPLEAGRTYRTWCASQVPTTDPLLGSLLTHALHAAASSRKQDAGGGFAGLAAGYGYSFPARTYYRDGYWTSRALLPFRPEWVREEIKVLAGGVHADGEAPSGVLVPAGGDPGGEFWPDHLDSPLFFAILIADYVATTGDRSPLEHGTVRDALSSIGKRYLALAETGGGLPLKPRHERDWADNVFRSGVVAYDAMLYLGALRSLAFLAGDDVRLRNRCLNAYPIGQRALERALWLPDAGHYAEYRAADGFVESHLAIDSLVGAWLGVLPPERERQLLTAAQRLLVTRDNPGQPYGDWGIMVCFPPYRRAADLRGKSRFAYRYHNGADWPYWDAVFAQALRKQGGQSGAWRHVLTRWWSYGLEQGWPEPVEYFSPPYGRGSPLQAWSGLAAAVLAESEARPRL